MTAQTSASVENARTRKKSQIQKIDTSVEMPYLLSELGEHLSTRPGYHTLYRYAKVGMPHSRDKNRFVLLETVEMGRRLHSTVEAFHRMVAEVNRK